MYSKNNNSNIQFQSLQLEFQNTMKLYEQGYRDYLTSLQNTNSIYKNISNSSFWGTGALNQYTDSSVSNCQALCSADKNCSGATFNNQSICFTRSGYGGITNEDGNTVLMTEKQYQLNNLMMLNDQLINLTKQMMQLVNDPINPLLEKQIQENSLKNSHLQKTYEILEAEKAKIIGIMKKNYEMNEQNKSEGLFVESANYKFTLWTIVTIILSIITLRILLRGE
jgi:hypothetical protein